jgi:hypothetical protein
MLLSRLRRGAGRGCASLSRLSFGKLGEIAATLDLRKGGAGSIATSATSQLHAARKQDFRHNRNSAGVSATKRRRTRFDRGAVQKGERAPCATTV